MSFDLFQPFLDLPAPTYVLLFVTLFQAGLFVAIWYSLVLERRRALRIKRKQCRWPRIKNLMIKLAFPYGGIFLTIGILGTFTGLAINVDSMDGYVKSVQDAANASSEARLALEAVRDAELKVVLSSVTLSLISTIVGIVVYFCARLTWPICILTELTFEEIERTLEVYREDLVDESKSQKTKSAGLYIDAVRILFMQAISRPHVSTDHLCDNVEQFVRTAEHIVEKDSIRLDQYAAAKGLVDLKVNHLKSQLERLKQLLESAKLHSSTPKLIIPGMI
ncbi:MAG: hypothetical protein AAGK02_14075 [Pseudomonadota bacterium]